MQFKQIECRCDECYVVKKIPDKCPIMQNGKEIFEKAVDIYKGNDFARNVCNAHSKLLGRGSSKWPRVEHIREFCLHMHIKKVGLACCSAFLKEGKVVKHYFKEREIESNIVCCKVGAVTLKDINIDRDIGYEYYLCNPIAQSHILNYHKTELNILMGLCTPHDMLFTWHSRAPVTTLFTKEYISNH
ncbi:MAG: DUF1847 domain-containing protein, partial [Thermodesulfobacteriota bacterium]|nr:DUF1847 domain-containing protein [Thermodesulfobacteriota bacterium]